MFGETWRDDDPALPWPNGRSVVTAAPSDDIIADMVQHQEATEEVRRAEAWSRVGSVFDILTSAAESGTLLWHHLSPVGREPMRVCPQYWFDEETFEHFFYKCRINPIDPHDKTMAIHDSWFHFIFVESDGLNKLLSSQKITSLPISAPPLQLTALETPGIPAINKGGRKNSRPTALAIYRERLVAGQTRKKKKLEAVEITSAWRGDVSEAALGTIERFLTFYHQRLKFAGREKEADQASATAVLALLDAELGSFVLPEKAAETVST